MKLNIQEVDNKVTLQVKFEEYGRYGTGGTRHTARVSGVTLLDALKKMCDKVGLYIDSDRIEDEGWTAQEVLDEIESTNGDGCDYIYFIKNLSTGDVLMNWDEPEEEDWDDEE